MTQKVFKFVIAIFALVLFANVVSSLSIITHPTSLSQSSGTFNITIDSDDSLTISLSSNSANLTSTNGTHIISGNNTIIPIIYDTSNVKFDLFNTPSITINVSDGSSYTTKTIPFESTTYCYDTANKGELFLKIEEVDVLWGYGEEDDFWYLRDIIEVEVLVDNDGSWDLSKIEVEWALYTESGVLIMDGKEKRFSLDRRDDTTIFITFKLDEKMSSFNGERAVLYVRATGEINDKKSAYYGNKTCAQVKTRGIDVIVDDDFVIVDDFKVNSNSVNNDGYYETDLNCGSEVTITGKLWNIGEDRQDDVVLEIYSNALGIDEKIEYSRIKAYGSNDFSYTFIVPKNIDEKVYPILFEVFDEDGDLFENGEDGTSARRIYVKVAGRCRVEAPTISAKLVEDSVVEGKTMNIKMNVVNNENHGVIYSVTAEGFESWAKLVSVKPEVLSINAAGSMEVTFTFDINKDAVGEKNFKINVHQNGEIIATQPISLEVESSSSKLKGLFEKQTLQIIGIVLINLLLVVAIIIVARKILSKK